MSNITLPWSVKLVFYVHKFLDSKTKVVHRNKSETWGLSRVGKDSIRVGVRHLQHVGAFDFMYEIQIQTLVGLLPDQGLTFILRIVVVSGALWAREGAIRDAQFRQSN